MTAHSHVRLQFRCLGNRSRKPSPDIEATPKTNLPISFALARSSPNMASYWSYSAAFSSSTRHGLNNNRLLGKLSGCDE